MVGVALFYAACIVCWAQVGRLAGLGIVYWAAMAIAAAQALWHVWVIRSRRREDCFTAFRMNHWLGFTVFAGVLGHDLLARLAV